MAGCFNRVLLIQLQPDILAEALADAIRHTKELSLMEPAPAGPEMLDVLKADDAVKPTVATVGEPALLDAYVDAISKLRSHFVVVTVPVLGTPLGLTVPGLSLSELINLLRCLPSGRPSARSGSCGRGQALRYERLAASILSRSAAPYRGPLLQPASPRHGIPQTLEFAIRKTNGDRQYAECSRSWQS
jgi:hypothetical protein